MESQPVRLSAGDYAPWFKARALSGKKDYTFDTVGGRHVLMLFYGSLTHAPSAAALDLVMKNSTMFDDEFACFFGVTVDPRDEASGRIAQRLPGRRFFLDYDKAVSRKYGALDREGRYAPHWLVLDRELRIVRRFPLADGEAALDLLAALVATASETPAPVLTVPRIFEPELCRELIALHQKDGGSESGYAQDRGGKTVNILDPGFKRRRDYAIEDELLQRHLLMRINRTLVPAIARGFQFTATRIERHLVASYEEGAGHFRAHRDNTTRGTAHRRFAVTINLNSDEYEGGDLCFPEFGRRTYRAPTGGAVVFSCSLLHEAKPVTMGRRYAYLPFLYDDDAAAIREANLDAVEHLKRA